MKKPYTHMEEANFRSCRKCGAPLKRNVTQRKPTADLCFPCYRSNEAARGHEMTTAREVKIGAKPGKKLKPVFTKEEWIARGRKY